MPIIVHFSPFFKLIVIAGLLYTTIIISPTFSLGSKIKFGLLKNYKYLSHLIIILSE